jgi:hypothetical protein
MPVAQLMDGGASGSLTTALSRVEIGGDISGAVSGGCEDGGISEIGGPSGWLGC